MRPSPRSHLLCPLPGRGIMSPSLSSMPWHGCTLGGAITEIHLSAIFFQTGSWTQDLDLHNTCLGRCRRIPMCLLRNPWQLTLPRPPCPCSQAASVTLTQNIFLLLSTFFCKVPNVRWKTLSDLTPGAACTTKSSADHTTSRLKWARVPQAVGGMDWNEPEGRAPATQVVTTSCGGSAGT